MVGNDRTVRFALWPHLITVEGPATELAALIESLYGDARIDRKQWSLATTSGVSRRVMAARLREHGTRVRRIGLAVLTERLHDEIERRVRAAGLKSASMHLPTQR